MLMVRFIFLYIFIEKMSHHTKDKGDIGLTKVIADLVEKGFSVSLPIHEHLPYDLIVDFNCKLSRIQIKYRKNSKNKKSKTFSCATNHVGSNGKSVEKKYTKTDFDLYAIYSPELNLCYYIPNVGQNHISIAEQQIQSYTPFYWYEDFLNPLIEQMPEKRKGQTFDNFKPICVSNLKHGDLKVPNRPKFEFLKKEIEELTAIGIPVQERLIISKRANLILPTHKILDAASEASKGTSKIGSTLKGIGPTYMDKTGRNGLRIGDILEEDFIVKYELLKAKHLQLLQIYNHDYELQEMEDAWFEAIDKLKELKQVESVYFINEALKKGKKILAEGAQGSMLDIDFGTYPFVTSSNLVSGSCAGGLGIPPWKITNIVGVIKAYSTRVGNGPYPAELFGDFADELRKRGNEFGTNTGRPRSVGWLDLVALRYLSKVNGLTGLAIMKADVLAGLEHIGIITSYRDKRTQKEMVGYPMTPSAWESVEPVIEFVDGWEEVASGQNLNKQYKAFIKKVEEFIDVPSVYISTGAERSEGLWM